MPFLGCFHGISQAGPVQTPKRGEGSLVDPEHTAAAEDTGSVKPWPRRDRRHGGVRVQDEEMKVLVDMKARFEKTALLGRRESRRDDALKALLG